MIKRTNTQRWVYFIAPESRAAVKIGTANLVEERIRSIQTNNHEKLTVLLAIEHREARGLERAIQSQFEEDRIRGEWFRLSPNIADFIERITAGDFFGLAYPRCLTGRIITDGWNYHRLKLPKGLEKRATKDELALIRAEYVALANAPTDRNPLP